MASFTAGADSVRGDEDAPPPPRTPLPPPPHPRQKKKKKHKKKKKKKKTHQTPKHWYTTSFLPSTTAVFSYAIGPRKLSANEQFCCCAQTVVSLLQTTEIKQGVSFIATDKVYTSTNKTLFFFYPGWMRLMFTCVLWRWVASAVILVPEP